MKSMYGICSSVAQKIKVWNDVVAHFQSVPIMKKKSVPKIFSIGQYLGVALDPWSFNNTEINFKIDVMQTWKLIVGT